MYLIRLFFGLVNFSHVMLRGKFMQLINSEAVVIGFNVSDFILVFGQAQLNLIDLHPGYLIQIKVDVDQPEVEF